MRKKYILFLIIFIVLIGLSLGTIYGKNNEKKKLIYLDPGHGGMDGGAVDESGQILEKKVVLDVAYTLKTILEKLGYEVKLTRTTDQSIESSKKKDIYKRVDLINESKAILYLSLHANSYPSKKVKGAQTFYSVLPDSKENNQLLAVKIMEKLRIIDSDNKRVAKEITNKYLLDHVKIPGCLIEVGFLSNDEDLEKLTNHEYIFELSWMITIGIEEYFKEVS